MTTSQERRYLVLVVGMLAGPGPASEVYRLSKRTPSSFHFVVPATKPDYGLTWTEGQAVADAAERLSIMLEFARAMGMEASGEVANTDQPVEAARRIAGSFDEVILIDNPRGLRRWTSDKAIAELAADPGLRVTHLRANPPLTQGKHFDTAELRGHFERFLADLQRSEGRDLAVTRPARRI